MTQGLKLIAAGALFAVSAFAHEYPLQFTAAAGARGLVVAGYQITGANVIGNCSYYTVTSGSGRGGGYHTYTTYYNQTCTWDLTGNLLSVATGGAPATPPALYTDGTRTVYATNGSSTTGSDSALLPNHGYVDTPSPHYTWGPFTPPPGPAAQAVTLSLTSDGDMPLDISAVSETTAVARSTMLGTNCVGTLAPGSVCYIVLYYNPVLVATPTGLAYETLTVTVTSDAPEPAIFSSHFTIKVRVGSND